MYFKERFPPPPPGTPLNPGRRRWIAPGTLFENHKCIQDKVCHFCKKAIPAGTPCKYRHMCVYIACMECRYDEKDGNYQ
jgi:hypothetical protein